MWLAPARIPALCLLVFLCLAPGAARADDEPGDDAPAGVSAEARDEALIRAFEWLDEKLLGMADDNRPRKRFAYALAGWAYTLASERSEGRKLPNRKTQLKAIDKFLQRYIESVERAYVKQEEDEGGARGRRPGMPPGFDMGGMEAAQFVWPLSVAAGMYAERAARGPRKSTAKRTLKTLVEIFELAQQEDGGFGHDDASREGMGLPAIDIPKPGGGSLEYPGTLLAGSYCAISALGMAHHALGTRAPKSLERGRAHFAASQSGDGSFPYDPSQKHEGARGMPGGMSAIDHARNGGCVLALALAGAPKDDPVLAKAMAAMDGAMEALSEGHGSATLSLLYGALCARARGEATWKRFREIFFARLLEVQQEDGSFLCACRGESFGTTNDTEPLPGMGVVPGMGASYEEGNRVYVTAAHVLILLLDRVAPAAIAALPQIADRPTGDVTPR